MSEYHVDPSAQEFREALVKVNDALADFKQTQRRINEERSILAERVQGAITETEKKPRDNERRREALESTSPDLLAKVETFVHLLQPGVEPAKEKETTQHFDALARRVLTTFILWQLVRDGGATLPGLRRCVMSTSDELHALLEEGIKSAAFGGALAESASRVLGLMTASPEEFSGAIATATRSIHR